MQFVSVATLHHLRFDVMLDPIKKCNYVYAPLHTSSTPTCSLTRAQAYCL
ncbi:hypothetical protein Syun_029823 [Stephania yunnanensis]|uniref:Uncharacterized protein n=1 Tax=Stephania yunnanensis TaxID=152371 RepID=A0AAP0EEK9_9MAGN